MTLKRVCSFSYTYVSLLNDPIGTQHIKQCNIKENNTQAF